MGSAAPQSHADVLCPPCMSIFSGQQSIPDPSQPTAPWPPPTHHPSVSSFETALRSGCVICHRMLVGLQKDGFNDLRVFDKQSPFSVRTLRERDKDDFDLELLVFYPDSETWPTDVSEAPSWFTFRQVVLSSKHYDGPTKRILADYGTSTGSKGAWEQACNWYKQCRHHHEMCNARRQSPSFLPNRILDLGVNDQEIRLLTGSERTIREYATLSHCWGSSDIICLRAENISQLQDAININELPQTFKDAVGVARKLGIFYLWIDSLCIIQDSLEDWQKESALMGEVYSNSVLNIMATACTNSHQGLYRDRDPRELHHCSFQSSWDGIKPDTLTVISTNTWDGLIKQAPLNGRGWVLQERILAPRALHFSQNQLAWECHEMDACEMYPDRLPKAFENLHSRVKLIDSAAYRNWVSSWRKYDPVDNVGYDVWGRIVRLYGGTHITKETDRLVAISGLAKRMRSILQDEYLAGLWRKHLPYQLVWHTFYSGRDGGNGRRLEKYRAPSWSWASIEGDVSMLMIQNTAEPSILIEIEEAKVTPLSDIDDTAEVIDGYIRLKGHIFEAELLGRDKSARIYSPRFQIDGRRVGGVIHSDEPVTAKHASVFFLPVYRESKHRILFGLILKAVEGRSKGWYSRIGVMSTWADDGMNEAWDYIAKQLEDPTFSNEALCLENNPRTIMLI